MVIPNSKEYEINIGKVTLQNKTKTIAMTELT